MTEETESKLDDKKRTLMTSFRLTTVTSLYLLLVCGKVKPVYTPLSLLIRISPGVESDFPRLMATTTTKMDVAKCMPSKKSTDTTGGKSQKSSGSGSDNKEKFTPFYSKASPFSQHHECTFKIEGNTYGCAEQYMMYQKAVVFKDDEMAKNILKSTNPVEQKRFGRKVKLFDPIVWNEKCEGIVRKANLAKFSQNNDLKSALLKTSGTTLVEASPRDRKWGVGLGVKNPKVHNRKTWRGKNLLGQILTSVRTELEKEVKQDSEDDSDSCDNDEKP